MFADKYKLLICSDSPLFIREFESDLKRDFDCQSATTLEMALFLLREWEPHVVLVDCDSKLEMLLSDLRRLQWTQFFGIVGATRDKSLKKEEKMFAAHVDQYALMPCVYQQLKWRLENAAKRMNEMSVLASGAQKANDILDQQSTVIDVGGIKIYPQDYLIKYNGQNLSVTPTQFKLLLAFVKNSDQLLSRDWIKEKVWDNSEISPRSIDAQISKLKKILPDLDRFIVNVYGKGYIFTHPNQVDAA